MPLPHFLMLLVLVVVLAGATLWLAVAAGLPLGAVGMVAVVAAAALHLSMRPGDGAPRP